MLENSRTTLHNVNLQEGSIEKRKCLEIPQKVQRRLCKAKGSGRPLLSEEIVAKVWKTLVRSRSELIKRTSLHIQICENRW